MNIELDMHTHTLASGHAFSTLQEMAKAGAEKGLKLLGITEHTPGIPGTCDPIYFRNLHVVPRQMYGIELMLGAEINILDMEGNLDADEELMKRLDIRIAGIHSLCYTHGTKEENTLGMVKAIRHPYIQIISHPGDGTALLDFEPMVLASKECGTLLEINMKHAHLTVEEIRQAAKYDVNFIIGSDAHVPEAVGSYRGSLARALEAGLDPCRIVNIEKI